MFRKRMSVCSLLAGVMLVLGSGSAWALVVYDSITPQISQGAEPVDLPSYRLAQQFQTVNQNLQVNTVTLSMFETGVSGSPTVKIYTDNSSGPYSVPGSLVTHGTLANPFSYPVSPTVAKTVFTASGLELAPYTLYWVVLEAPSGSFSWSYASILPDITQYGEWYADPPNSYLSDSNFTDYTDYSSPFQMIIEASDPSSVPEPSTILLLGTGFGAALYVRRRKMKNVR